MSENYCQERSTNNSIEKGSVLNSSIVASKIPAAAIATSASATLSRNKTKLHTGDEDIKLTHPTILFAGCSLNHAKVETKDKQSKFDYPKIINYHPLTLVDIRNRIIDLYPRVPTIPEEGLSEDGTAVFDWASKTQIVIEEFNLLLSCVSPVTYKWASDRSGAADQNLCVLSGELSNIQEQISTCLSQRLSNVLEPVVSLVIKSTTIHVDQESGVKTRTNEFAREVVDPVYLKMNCNFVRRNAIMLRQVILANFHKAAACIKDYMDASQNDNQIDHQRSFAY
jgi:hypothetical protein